MTQFIAARSVFGGAAMPADRGRRHSWDVTPQQARQIQTELAADLIEEDRFDPISTVAGVDVGFEDQGATTRAAVVVLNFPTLEPVEQVISRLPTHFPYVPGLLSFREIPAVLQALAKLTVWPDLLLCDGQGIAHPRRFGIASHLGVLTDRPTIGVAKSRLYGSYGEVPETRGGWTPLLTDNDEIIGAALRTRERVKPVFVSLGHKISLASAIDYVMACATRYRLPETTRMADRLASNRR